MNQTIEAVPVPEKKKRKTSGERKLAVAPGDGDHSDSNMKNMETIMSHLGFLYRKANLRIKLAIYGNAYVMGSEAFLQDCCFVSTVDNIILSCSTESQTIIRRQFFEESEENWYEDFYSRETFRRHLFTAMVEFLRRCKTYNLPESV